MNNKDPMKIAMKNIKKDDKILKVLAGKGTKVHTINEKSTQVKSMDWQHYYELEAIHRMRNEGRELIGEYVVVTEKRDGENVSLSLTEKLEPLISSHNQEIADPHIARRFIDTPEYHKAVELLDDELNFDNHFILFGELMIKVCPTRIERNKKHLHWILFDIYDKATGKYLSYNAIYQKAYHYHIPIVKQLDAFMPKNMDEINAKKNIKE